MPEVGGEIESLHRTKCMRNGAKRNLMLNKQLLLWLGLARFGLALLFGFGGSGIDAASPIEAAPF